MRTRFLPKMTHHEVAGYVERNDIIYVPIGTVEVHGTFPMDIENTAPEAFALLMAEQTDGLVLGQLPYFFCGASPMSPGTIQMSTLDGLHYLKAIAHSLLNQGFRRQVYLSLHGPAFLTGGTLVTDFFDETKCPIAYLDMVTATRYLLENGRVDLPADALKGDSAFWYGPYEILEKKQELVVDPQVAKTAYPLTESHTIMDQPNLFGKYASGSGSIGFYYNEPQDHVGMSGAVATVEERDHLCLAGAKMMRTIVDAMDMQVYVEDMRRFDRETQERILPKYGSIVPRNRFHNPYGKCDRRETE